MLKFLLLLMISIFTIPVLFAQNYSITTSYSTDISSYYPESSILDLTPEQQSNLMLFQAIDSNDIVLFQDLIDKGVDVNVRNNKYRTPLMSLNDDQLEFAKILLKKDVYVNTRDRIGNTALIITAEKGYHQLVQLLIDNQALVNAVNKEKLSAIHFAVQKGYTDIVLDLLKKKASMTDPYPNGTSLIIEASRNGYTRIVDTLLQYGANVNDMLPQSKTSVLGVASAFGSYSLVELLLDNKANINQTNELGVSPIFLAVANKQYDIVELLLKKDADITIVSKDGLSIEDFFQSNDNKMKQLFKKYR